MSRDIAETSIFLAFLQKIERAYGLLKGGLVKILRASRTYTLMNKFQAGTRANFKYKLKSNVALRLLAWLKLQKRKLRKLKRRNKPL